MPTVLLPAGVCLGHHISCMQSVSMRCLCLVSLPVQTILHLVLNNSSFEQPILPVPCRHWTRLLDALDAAGSVHTEGLPVACQQHGALAKICTPSSFTKISPNGGCTLPCSSLLPCGHKCVCCQILSSASSCQTFLQSRGVCLLQNHCGAIFCRSRLQSYL